MRFTANETNNWDTIATASGSQGSLEVFNTAPGNDAFMCFHAGADHAIYFGLDADSNKLAVGGWSMGANKYAIYHEGNKPSLSALSGTAATATALTAGSKTISGSLTVGNTTHSDIFMVDTNEGTRRIHCNSNRIGFLSQAGNWSAYSTDAGRWECGSGLTVSNGLINNNAGINYVGTTVTGGTSNMIGFRWIGGPNTVNVGVDNAVNIVVGTASDYRLKIVTTNDIGDSLSRLKSLNTYEYTSKDEDTGTVYRGVLAHEVAKLFPNLVQGAKDDPDQLQSVDHAAFTIELIQAMKQLDARLTAIEAHLNIEAAELVIPDYEPVASPDFVFPVLTEPEQEASPTEE
tara:strand:- start:1520 stop:2557 length:1038 start_codon:yes stop_codon:yes gene_type:complete